jgi:hypothetical protein
VATPGFWLVYWAATLHVALVFPKRVRIIQRRPYLIGLLYLTAFSLYFAYLGLARYQSINTLDWLNEWATGENMIAGLYLSLTMVVILYQFRTSREGSERIKIRWAVYGAFISGITGLVFWIIYPAVSGNTILSANVLGLLMLPFPLSLAIAIGRHKLFDIDVIIQRTLVYGVLTTMLAIIYLISVVALQQIFRSLTGQSSPLAIVASTLLIAGLFNPLRHRVQDIIDQRFYRRKYDAEKTLNAFSKYSQNEVDLIKLSKQLLTVSQLTFQPDNLSLWISQQTKPSKLSGEIIQSYSIERQIPHGDS